MTSPLPTWGSSPPLPPQESRMRAEVAVARMLVVARSGAMFFGNNASAHLRYPHGPTFGESHGSCFIKSWIKWSTMIVSWKSLNICTSMSDLNLVVLFILTTSKPSNFHWEHWSFANRLESIWGDPIGREWLTSHCTSWSNDSSCSNHGTVPTWITFPMIISLLVKLFGIRWVHVFALPAWIYHFPPLQDQEEPLLKFVLNQCDLIESLDLRGLHLNEDIVRAINQQCPRLSCAKINFCSFTKESFLLFCTEICPKLVHLSCDNTFRESYLRLFESCTKLEQLEVRFDCEVLVFFHEFLPICSWYFSRTELSPLKVYPSCPPRLSSFPCTFTRRTNESIPLTWPISCEVFIIWGIIWSI